MLSNVPKLQRLAVENLISFLMIYVFRGNEWADFHRGAQRSESKGASVE